MLSGKQSEKFIPEPQAVNTVIQQTLGAEFDLNELEQIIKVAVTEANAKQADKELQKSSRKKKRYQYPFVGIESWVG